MQCFIYRSEDKADHYLYLPTRLEDAKIPSSLMAMLGELSEVMELDLQVSTKLATADASTVIESLQTRHFYLQMPPKDQPHPFDLPH